MLLHIDADDIVLGEFQISSTLAPGAAYTRRATVTVPKAIFGDFYIILWSDVYNQVYEHTSEDDNTRVSNVSNVIRDVLYSSIESLRHIQCFYHQMIHI